ALRAAPGLRAARARGGPGDRAVGGAPAPADVAAALDVGAGVAADLVGGGARALVTGDMGIGNTTPSAAVIAALTGRPAVDVTGRGTGLADATPAPQGGAGGSGPRPPPRRAAPPRPPRRGG